MKSLYLFQAAIACLFLLTSCDKQEEHLPVYPLDSYPPFYLYISVVNAEGCNLLDNEAPLLELESIKVYYKGYYFHFSHEWQGEQIINVTWGSHENGYSCLAVGPWNTNLTYTDENIIISWGDDSIDEIVFSSDLVETQKGIRRVQQSFYLNGRINTNNFFTVIK